MCPITQRLEWIRVLLVTALVLAVQGDDSIDSMLKYISKTCKYNVLPSSLSSRAFTKHTGEVHVSDVFGVPSSVKQHIMQINFPSQSLFTLQAEVHRDTPVTLSVDAYRRGEAGKTSALVFVGSSLLGSGGEGTKAFLHGLVSSQDLELDVVFSLVSIEVAAAQVNSRVTESRCHPLRLDLTIIPSTRAPFHWPTSCPAKSKLPTGLKNAASANGIAPLGDDGFTLEAQVSKSVHYTYNLEHERPWKAFERSLWNRIIEVPPRLHRFVRFFIRTSFRFASGPLQLVIELFDIKENPDQTALFPSCTLGCLGGVPVFNGQIIDHAMPTGFRYRLWLLAASVSEWTRVIPERGRHCLEFDFDYSIKFEERMTPFEVGPSAWLCESSRLPSKILQTQHPEASDKLSSVRELLAGRSIWIRDRFGFPPDEANDMEHEIEIEISEESIFRVTTHQSEGVDVFIKMRKKDAAASDGDPFCPTTKHPGQVPRQTIFCFLEPGLYTLVFFADYPLGGLHPCSDFFAQVAIRPRATASDATTRQCISSATDLSEVSVVQSLALTTEPRWKNIKIPITFSLKPSTVIVWSQDMTVEDQDVSNRLYLRLVVHSDYLSSDLRFQLKFEGKYVADTQVTAHGYADMIGPLDPGTYTVQLYYVQGTAGQKAKDLKLCSMSMVDLRVVSRTAYNNATSQWICSSTRVPPPTFLSPQPDEQVLLDSEYLLPSTGYHTIRFYVREARVLRVRTSSADSNFLLELRPASGGEAIATGDNDLYALVESGSYTLKLITSLKPQGSGAECATFMLNILLHPKALLPVCPWAPDAGSSDSSSIAEIQKRADDHIGDVLLNLVPQHLTKDLSVADPVTLWMSPGMEKTFDMEVDATVAVRVELVMHPPWLPIEVSLRRKRPAKLEAPIASGEWTESRLLLMQSDLPRGKYTLEIRQKTDSSSRRRESSYGSGEDSLLTRCSHVTIFAEVGVASKEAMNSLRSELLDLPDLLAVQPFLQSLNTVGWFGSNLAPVIGTQVYSFKENTPSTELTLDDRSVIRVICEPADLSNAEIQAELIMGTSTIASSDELGQLVAEADPGQYKLRLTPKKSAPFLVTIGVASQGVLRQDVMTHNSGAACSSTFPQLAKGINFAPKGWTIGPTLVRLASSWTSQSGELSRVPITISSPSVLYIEAGSALPLDLVRISLQVPEGLWVGEQRGLRNSLEIELPPGKYVVHVSQPKPISPNIVRCLEFSVLISAKPMNPDAVEDEEDAKTASTQAGALPADGTPKVEELTAREEAAVQSAPCFSMGTVPLPLDLSDPQGGSEILGGPLSQSGHLLIRSNVMITDMHDGRKKMYLGTAGRKLQLKVGVSMGGYGRLSMAHQMSFTVIPPRGGAPVEPVEVWNADDGWERMYLLDNSNYWLAFHHGHRERAESACLHFGLVMQIHPVDDMQKMMECSGNTGDSDDMFPGSLDMDQSLDSPTVFSYKKPMMFLRQVQNGFLKKIRFRVAKKTWISAEVGFNFFSSHAEMDLVHASNDRTSYPIVSSEMDSFHMVGHALNMRLVLSHMLNPGDYVLRVADDHYRDQLGQSTACFPFSFEFHAVPEGAAPTVVSVQPHPSVPVPTGVDLVLTIRFSEAPAGSLEEVVSMFGLGGIQATSGGSLKHMHGRYASSKKRAIVQASASEGNRVWVIGWDASSLEDITGVSETAQAKLTLGSLKSNATGRPFRFVSPTYTFVVEPRGKPWQGVSATSDSDRPKPETPASTPVDSQPVPESSSVGSPQVEDSSSNSAVGMAQPEASSTGSVGMPKPEGSSGYFSNSGGSGTSGDFGAIHSESRSQSSDSSNSAPVASTYGAIRARSYAPDRPAPSSVSEYDPMGEDTSGRRRRTESPRRRRRSSADGASIDDCPEGLVRNAVSGICEEPGRFANLPLGFRSVTLSSVVCLAVLALAFQYWPRLKKMSTLSYWQGGTGVSARFRDIGARTSEEEIGLVKAVDHYDDDDML